MNAVWYTIVLLAYVLLMLGIGWWYMRRNRSVGDFFLGGRAIGPWMSAFAYGTTYFSAVLLIGYAGKLGWSFGIHTMWIVVGNTLFGTLLAWKVLAGRTREMTANLQAITMPEFLGTRFESKPLQLLAALVVFVFLVPYSASVLMGLSYLFEMTLHIPYTYALYLLTALTAVYLVMGGYLAVAFSDFVRGLVEFGGVLVMVAMLAGKVGGFRHATAVLWADPAAAPALAANPAHLGWGWLQVTAPGWLTLACLVLITSFGPWSLPQMVQKFYAIRSRADVTRALIIAGIFSLFMAFGAYYSGALAHLFYANHLPAELMSANGPIWDKIMPHFIVNAGLPPILVLVVVLMVFSASMSSISSLVLVSSSAIAVDFYGALADRHANPRRTMVLMRVFCALFVGLSLFLALHPPTFIVNMMIMSWGTLSGAFLAPYVYGLFWKGTTKAGVCAGMLTGLGLAVLLFPQRWGWGQAGVPLAGAVCMIVPLFVVPLVSLVTRKPNAALIEKAFDTQWERRNP